jgi:hypothetical protein
MNGLPGLSEMIENFPNYGFEAIKFFPLGFGPVSPSNSGFGWRNIARIGLFACPHSRAVRYSSRLGKATATDLGLYQHLRPSASSHKSSPKRKSLMGFLESQQSRARASEGPRIRAGKEAGAGDIAWKTSPTMNFLDTTAW